MSPLLKELLVGLRQHPHFPLLLAAIPRPQLPRFRTSQAQEVEKARANWIYRSGQAEQHELWLSLLTGTYPEPSQQE